MPDNTHKPENTRNTTNTGGCVSGFTPGHFQSQFQWHQLKSLPPVSSTGQAPFDTGSMATRPLRDSYFPPRKECAQQWHQRLLAQLPNLQSILLIGQYAQKHYLDVNPHCSPG